MLTELELAYFKAFGNKQRIPLRPITLIFGANSSGKSSILHSLLLAHHGVTVGDFDVTTPVLAGDAVDLGGFRRFVYSRKEDLKIHLGFSFEDVSIEDNPYGLAPTHSVKTVFEIEPSIYDEKFFKHQIWLDGRALITLRMVGESLDVIYINTDHPYLEERLARVQRRLHKDRLVAWRNMRFKSVFRV